MSDKSGWKDRAQQFWDSRWHSRDPGLGTSPAKENIYRAGVPNGYIVSGCWGAKTEIPVKTSVLRDSGTIRLEIPIRALPYVLDHKKGDS